MNYDLWLTHQLVIHRRGIVLAMTSRGCSLAEGLKERWFQISWTQLGLAVETILESGALPDGDTLLGRHLAGFIRMHLWKESEMPDAALSFDDVALIRAFATMGPECEERVSCQRRASNQ